MRKTLKRLLIISLLGLLAPGVYGVFYGCQQVRRGVNDSGAEFPAARARFERLKFSSEKTIQYFSRFGLKVVRTPVAWESLQPTLDGPLDAMAVQDLKRYIRMVGSHGMGVIVDIHNYARYTSLPLSGPGRTYVIGDKGLPISVFARFWGRLAAELKDEPGIFAYGLMNEPHDIVTQQWERASQAALLAIRRAGDNRLILVPGSNWSAAHMWLACHGHDSWIQDPARNFIYEAHFYFSWDYQKSFAEESKLHGDMRQAMRNRLRIFVDWCLENGVNGFIGEAGCPAEPEWCEVLEDLLTELDRVHMGATLWAAGERWPEVKDLVMQPTHNFSVHRPQTVVLARHPGGRTSSLFEDWKLGYQICTARLRYFGRKAKALVR